MPEILDPPIDGADGIYHVGTLTYTKAALAILFFWLLWGDFCYTVMESVNLPIMVLKFDKLGASNLEIGLMLSTIPAIVYTVLNPIVSFKSDRHRGRFGRRIPFILFTLPFLVICLIALAFGERLGFALHHHGAAPAHQLAMWFDARGWHYWRNVQITPAKAALWTLGVLLVAFSFFNSFVTSIFWYLFNDVVPEILVARFMSWFRMIAMLSGSFYQFCIFKYSGTHSATIFVGAAMLYLVGFGLMCLNVKEGKYPAPAPFIHGGSGPIAAITTYATECHALKHYWTLWICTFVIAIGNGMGTFGLLFSTKAIGLNLEQIGYINGTVSIVGSIMILASGWLADRFHPIRVVFVGVAFSTFVTAPLGLIWLFWHPSNHLAFVYCLVTGVGLTAPLNALLGVWDPPLLMRLFPRDRYGQFCSTNAVWRAAGGILGGALAGAFLDLITRWVGQDRAYRYIPAWNVLFGIPGLILFFQVYRSWKRYGGDEYVPPVPTLPGVPGLPAISALDPIVA